MVGKVGVVTGMEARVFWVIPYFHHFKETYFPKLFDQLNMRKSEKYFCLYNPPPPHLSPTPHILNQ